MVTRKRYRHSFFVLGSLLFCASVALADRPKVAVFNFQMKSDTPDWLWLEKGLADRMITDLFQEKSISVVQRDVMQKLAEEMFWVPEMMGDPERLQAIQKALKLDYLVSGVYEIKGQELSIIAMVVDFDTKKEVIRRKVIGPADQAIDLTRTLSAKLLSWFSKRPQERILPELPVWTRSTPAAKALYEGIDLYDQGRYPEGWLKFRQAARQDPQYTEAQYWVGRMYYFMDRYEHARWAYEHFVYMDTLHPRLGDAIKEYLHTYEKLDTPPEKLLTLYDEFASHYPSVKIYKELGMNWLKNEYWLWIKKAHLLGQLGRHVEAAELASKVVEKLSGPQGDPWRLHLSAEEYAYCVAMGNAQRHNMLTAEAILPKGLEPHYPSPPFRFSPGQKEAVSYWPWPFRTLPKRHEGGLTYWRNYYAWWFVVAPDGYVFKKLRFYPIVKEFGREENTFSGVLMHKDSYNDIPLTDSDRSLRKVAEEGVEYANLPRSGLFHVHCYLGTRKPFIEPGAYIRGMRAVAELEKIGPHGGIDVTCTNSSHFNVDVDARLGRRGPGLIGLLPPGQHTLRFYPSHKDSPFGEHIETVTVRQSETVSISVKLPWKKDSPWSNWTTASLIGRGYPPSQHSVGTVHDCPSIQADQEAIRLIWSRGDDLWASSSTDGDNFSIPAKLPMPISSGWKESDPVLLRDFSGRFVLAFLSDRNARHEMRPYVCWSRDFVHWSSPVMVQNRPVQKFDMIQDDRRRFILVDNTSEKVTVHISRDLYRWEQASEVGIPAFSRPVRIIQHQNGTYELFVVYAEYKGSVMHRKTQKLHYDVDLAEVVVVQYASKDLSHWSFPTEITRYRGPGALYISPISRDNEILLACFKHWHNSPWDFMQMFRKDSDGKWAETPRQINVTTYTATAALTWHPRWGYMIAWDKPPSRQFPTPPEGPYLIRGKSVDEFGFVKAMIQPPPDQVLEGFDLSQVQVVTFPEPWRFKIDPGNQGVMERFFDPAIDDSQWAAVRTDRDAGWDSQGFVEHEVGFGWYRAALPLSEKDSARKFKYLYFEAVDEEAWIYVNGQQIFEHSVASTGLSHDDLWDMPFSVPLTGVELHGKDLLAVRVYNREQMGGIWKPVHLVLSDQEMTVEQLYALFKIRMRKAGRKSVAGARYGDVEIQKSFK